ncbi:hypothetical protein PRK78_003053 [Emydomyces testavorans]|uniref:Nucleoporin NUP37 n=1 Tax=Emydomyces testavorans TaxID=2070801 RepID=A0AAF0DFD0_9EURO|nr:hypothetical protein PRK78_003053 [Emydomyces testavorans]
MELSGLEPLVHSRSDGLQLSYEFPHRVYDARVYPVQAPNGSTIIIYGHEMGIRILWRGGRRIKPYEENKDDTAEDVESKANDGNDDVVMIIDSDDEDNAPAAQKEVIPTIQYEEEEDEIDPRRPFLNIVQQFDIHLGVKAFKLSIPSILPGAIRPLDSVPPVLSKMIIVTAACADSSIRLIAAPLSPPPPTGSPYPWDFQTLTIPAQNVHSVPAIMSMTLTCEKPDDKVDSRSRSRGREDIPPKPTGTWKLLLAVHSMEAAGKLSIHQLRFAEQPIQASYPYKLSTDDLIPIQELYLSSPAKSMAFNPSQYPSDRHAHLLLAYETGSVELYSFLSPKPQKVDRRRSRANTGQTKIRAKWLFTFYTDFDQSSPELLRRKKIVDAKWALGGRTIMALTTEGEWGLWDTEGSGPDQRGLENVSTISAGQLSSFVLRGRVTSSEVSSNPQSTRSASPAQQNKLKFAPMTPSTRRMREEALFKGASQRTVASNHSYRGCISVIPTNQGWDKPVDESVLIWHGDKNVRIPSLLSLWKCSTQPSEVARESPNQYKPTIIEKINLLGELESGICYIPFHSRSSANKSSKDSRPDILITAETRLLILASKLQLPEEEKEDQEMVEQNATADLDQVRLQRGELDLDGMGRVLAGMAGSAYANRPNTFKSPQNALFS